MLRLQLAPGDFARELLAECARELLFRHESQLEQVRAQPATVKDLPVERFVEPFLSELARAEEDLTDAHARRPL